MTGGPVSVVLQPLIIDETNVELGPDQAASVHRNVSAEEFASSTAAATGAATAPVSAIPRTGVPRLHA